MQADLHRLRKSNLDTALLDATSKERQMFPRHRSACMPTCTSAHIHSAAAYPLATVKVLITHMHHHHHHHHYHMQRSRPTCIPLRAPALPAPAAAPAPVLAPAAAALPAALIVPGPVPVTIPLPLGPVTLPVRLSAA
jgi:hypothetical protein